MPRADYLLSFVTDESGQYVAVHADLNGIEHLITELERLRQRLLEDDCPHTHLFASKAGDGQLTQTKLQGQQNEKTPVWHVKIYGWNDEWARKHGLKPEISN